MDQVPVSSLEPVTSSEGVQGSVLNSSLTHNIACSSIIDKFEAKEKNMVRNASSFYFSYLSFFGEIKGYHKIKTHSQKIYLER